MDIKIKMLNVGDGDAIIIHLKKTEGKQCVILIDGGHAGDAEHTIDELDSLLTIAGKAGPDLIVCTHYDADHIGGLKKIIQKYGQSIGLVWIHQPGIQKQAMLLAQDIKASRIRPVDDFRQFDEIRTYENAVLNEDLYFESEFILESYDQMEKLVSILNENKIKNAEPFSGDSLTDWPEVKVLGPSKSFYKTCYDKISKPNKLLLQEVRALKRDKDLLLTPIAEEVLLQEKFATNPCGFLDEQKKDHVTEVNQVSVILEITSGEKKYLFTGDASIESFKNLPGYPDILKDIYWLKVAHHGSHNNSSSELFDIMQPKYAYISGGDRYLDDEVRDCLKSRGTTVRTTRDEKKDIIFPE